MTDTEVSASGIYETKAETALNQAAKVKRWLDEIALTDSTEKDWRKEGQEVVNIYRAEKEGKDRRFNIVYSNTQTRAPSLYNSTPIPDVRPRYNDPNEVSRLTSQTVERALSYSLDAYDFDATMKSVVQDMVLPGRGTARVRYAPFTDPETNNVYDEVQCEHVLWKNRRQGHADRWADVPWVAYELFLTRDQLLKLNPEIGGGINLDVAVDGIDKDKSTVQPNVFRRAKVWEIWSKADRKVLFICPAYLAAPIREEDDPLGLINFFPEPEPLYGVKTSDSMVPVCPYRIVKPLVDELEEITKRIQALVRVIRWRGYQDPRLPSFERLDEAEDGELIPATDELLQLVQAGGLEKFVWLMPIDLAMKALQQLYVQREQIKQTIFEVDGLSDILRGATDPNETLGAQEIKANFGSMRLSDQQKDVQRFCRDLMRLKAEIICTHFSPENIAAMTGMALPSKQEVEQAKARLQQLQKMQQMQGAQPQLGPPGGPPPGMANGVGATQTTMPIDPDMMAQLQKTAESVSWDEVMATMRSGMMRQYRIDIETDSTIRGEIRTQQQSASTFLDGTAKFVQAVGPAVQEGWMPGDVAVDLYAAFTRFFKLGKQAEDALSRMSHAATEAAKQPQQEKPDPEMMKAQIAAKTAEQQMAHDRETHAMDMQTKQADLQGKQQLKTMDLGVKQKTAELDFANKQREADLSFAMQQKQQAIDQAAQEQEMQQEQEMHARNLQSSYETAALDEFLARMKADREDRMAERKPN
jgi:hypothetical protein